MNRLQFQKIARIRLREAEALRQARMFSGAYDLAGYAVECGLKACIAKLTKRHDFPEKDFVRKSYTHDFLQLIKTAELDKRYQGDLGRDSQLAGNWRIVIDWSEESRYAVWTRAEAGGLIDAITEVPPGGLQSPGVP